MDVSVRGLLFIVVLFVVLCFFMVFGFGKLFRILKFLDPNLNLQIF